MRHRVRGRKLKRTTEHRLALLRGLATELLRHGKIRTTVCRAKELRPFTEKLITRAKREGLHSRRVVLQEIQDRDVVYKLFDTVAARYASRPGGYTRIVRVGRRPGDNAEMAVIQLLAEGETPAERKGKKREPKAGEPGASIEAKLKYVEERKRSKRAAKESDEAAPEGKGEEPAPEEEKKG